MTAYRNRGPHAYRRPASLRFDARYITVALMLLSAAVTVAVLWFAFSVLLSFGTYLETVLP